MRIGLRAAPALGLLLALGLAACSDPPAPDTDVGVRVVVGGQYTDVTSARLRV